MALLDDVKTNLRISTSALNGDVQDDIDAALMDLYNSGVVMTDEDDPLIIKAVKLYCRAQNDFMGKGEQYSKAYEGMKIALSLSGDYNEVGGDV